MSRIGKLPIQLPKNVTVSVADGVVAVKGPLGQTQRALVAGTSVAVDGGVATVSVDSSVASASASHGLVRALVANMVKGVSQGFERRLEIHGVGYKAEARGSTTMFSLGYSHPIEYKAPDGVKIEVDKNTKVLVKGIDKETVGQVASEIRAMRPPDSYKGKGVRYVGERVRLKAGKAGQK
jgi:large subunit ribosomal protein L6